MHKKTIAFLAASAVASTMSLAHASFPAAVWVKPTKVEYTPDKATATEVVMRGTFLIWNAGKSAYDGPAVGYVHYTCPTTKEKTCRMEWSEIEAQITSPADTCRGFGSQSEAPGTLSSEGTPLGTADLYPLQMGVVQGFSPCQQIKTFNEMGAGGAAGAAGAGGSTTAGAGGSTTAGAGGTTAGAGGTTAGAGGSTTAGAGGTTAGAGGSTTAGSGGSTVAGAGGSPSAGAGGSATAGAAGSGTAGSGTAGSGTAGSGAAGSGTAGSGTAGGAGKAASGAGGAAAAPQQAEDDGGCSVTTVRATDFTLLVPLAGLAVAWASRRRRR